jgi:hypothetical protein
MTDPTAPDASRPGPGSFDPERDAKIDELLLAGLEHYFAGRYQEAINIWGRVQFLDRSHARARAYIERARGALAERVRHSEELLHEGVAAIQRGDGETARGLLESAAAHGESRDVALDYLARLDHLATAGSGHDTARDQPKAQARRRRSVVSRGFAGRAPGPVRTWPLVAGVLVIGALVVVASAFDLFKPLVELSWGTRIAGPTVPTEPEPLPIPRAGELSIGRARALSAAGRLRDALAQLDHVIPGDPSYAEAEQLRAEIQRVLVQEPGQTEPAAMPAPEGSVP